MIDLIHQTLHGYHNGHKLLLSSIELNPETKSILLRESDSPGEEFHSQNEHCYSGFSLVDAGYYVISKTWVATEINRPGCVWTHSILIPFSMLAIKGNSEFWDMESLFLERSDINSNLLLNPIDRIPQAISEPNRNVSMVFSKVFSENQQTILSKDLSSLNDIVFIWGRLWPKMKRNFSFKTWSPKKLTNSYHEYSLVLNESCKVDLSDDWGAEFFKSESSIHDFSWKYGASLDGSKLNVFNIFTLWSLFEINDSEAIVEFALRWNKCPVSLVKNIIFRYSQKPITLNISYLIGKYILTLDHEDISEDKISKVGELLCLKDNNFFMKILKSDFPLKKHFVSSSFELLDSIEKAKLINEGVVDFGDVNQIEVISSSDFWDELIDKESFLKSLIDKNKVVSFSNLSFFNDVDWTKLDHSISIPIITFNFNIERRSHREFIKIHEFDVINLINVNFKSISKGLSDFILENYSISSLMSLSDECSLYLWEKSGKENKKTIKSLEIICLDKEKPRPLLLESVFNELFDKVSNYSLSYLDMSEVRRLIKLKVKEKFIYPNSLLSLLVFFLEEYMRHFDISISSELQEKIDTSKVDKKNKQEKQSYGVFWFLDL